MAVARGNQSRVPSRTRARVRRTAAYVAAGALLVGPAAATSASGPATAISSGGVAPSATPAPAAQHSRRAETQIPCATPDTTGSVAATTKAADQAAASGKAWTGVLERVLVTLNADGSVSGTPSQHTRVTASGNSAVTVRVPVSGPVTAKRKKAGRGTPVVDHEARVHLSPQGSAEQLVKTSFTRPLPVAVSVKYHLDGKPISAADLVGKSGTVTVTYRLSNVSARSMSACFEGFDGQHQHITLRTPLPIFAWLSFTLPKEAQTFSAPGSSLSPDSNGVDVGWTAPLFQPFGATERTFTLTMKTSQATIPTAVLWLDTVDPFTLTGKTPTASAQALGVAASAVATGQAAVQRSLASIQQAAAQLQSSTTSSGGTGRGHGEGRGAAGDRSAELGRLLVGLDRDLRRLELSLRRQTSDAARMSSSARATAALASEIAAKAADIGTQVDELTARQSVAVQGATQQVDRLEQVTADLQDLPAGVQGTPEFLKLASDLGVALDTANTVRTAVTDAEQLGQSIASGVAEVEGSLTTLVSQTKALQSAAASLAEQARRDLDRRVTAIDRRLSVFQRRFATFQLHVSALRDRVAATAARIKARFARAKAAARRDLEHLLLQGEQAIQTSADQAQAELAQTEAHTRSVVAQADTLYAQLLTLDQQAVLYQIPGGTAPNVSEQTGVYRYKISGTSGADQRQATRKDRREQRQSARQDRRHHRHHARQDRRDRRQSNRQQRRSSR